MKKVLQKINKIRAEIDVPKTRYNKHSGFYFRNLGDIFTAINPVFLEYQLSLVFKESVVLIEGNTYMKVTAVVYDLESDDILEIDSYAKEPIQKSNFDAAQITTSTSSIAKKAALSTLLCLDDTSESKEKELPTEKPTPPFDKNTSLASEKQINLIKMLIKQTDSDLNKLLENYKIASLEKASFKTASDIINVLNDKKARLNKDGQN